MNNFLNKLKTGETLNIVEKKRIWFILPLIVIVLATAMFTTYSIKAKKFSKGLNVGIDFTGGTILNVRLGENEVNDTTKDAIRKLIEDKGMNVSNVQTSGEGAEKTIVIKYTSTFSEQETATKNKEIRVQIYEDYEGKVVEAENDVTFDYIGATTSGDLIFKALTSIIVAGIVILLYIIIRFEIFSGIAAIIALLHDVLMMFAFVTIFHIELNSYFIAIVITIIVYSINNTIVVFDRVRENLDENINRKFTYSDMVNKAVTETMGRSINTTITTLCTITMLAILGVPIIRDFSLMIIAGIVAGTFSSILIAPSLYSLIRDKEQQAMSITKKAKKPKNVKKSQTKFKAKKR